MKKKTKITIIILLILVLIGVGIYIKNATREEDYTFKSVGTSSKLKSISNQEKSSSIWLQYLTLPFSLGYMGSFDRIDIVQPEISLDTTTNMESSVITGSTSSAGAGNNKDYSTTNVQVENVDEADITKTDGDYIYSISENHVIITDVKNPEEIKIAAKVSMSNSGIPEDLLLYNNKLIIIGNNNKNYSPKTIVNIFDITYKEKPNLIKKYSIDYDYYTSRCISNKLYIISAGYIDSDGVMPMYQEDNTNKEIGYENIKYIPQKPTDDMCTIAVFDLDNLAEVKVKSYLMNIENAYISENYMYLIEDEWEYDNQLEIKDLFGPGGIIGLFKKELERDSGYYTKIYKFSLNGSEVEFEGMTKETGRTLNQFSFDEYKGNLRAALEDNDGTKIVVWDKNLNKIGSVENIAEGEDMYASRFIGEKAYLVTYQTIDPLFVVSLEDPRNPTILGELKIPGYSTYLHPYDENHIIGIGMETEEKITRNSSGKVISTTATIVGMKMAIFDVSDVNNPTELSNIVIGDSRTTSSILTNHKALLFSKEKNLIAIPVNNYSEDFEITSYSDNMSQILNRYKNYNKNYISEGYLVYDLSLEEGFEQKGIITHDLAKSSIKSYYRPLSNMLRGMYIEENLYTVSETAVKVNKLDNLELVSEIKITD